MYTKPDTTIIFRGVLCVSSSHISQKFYHSDTKDKILVNPK